MPKYPLPAAAILAAVCVPAVASAQDRQQVVVARTGVVALNLPDGSSVGSGTADLNDARQIALDVNFVGDTGNPGVFLGSYGGMTPSGGIVAGAGDSIGDVSLDDAGRVAYTVGLDDDLFLYDSGTITQPNYPFGVSGSSGLTLTDRGAFGGRLDVGFSGDVFGTFPVQTSGNPPLTQYAADDGVDSSSPFSFLYVPAVSDDAPVIASKVSLDAFADQEIRRFTPAGSTVIARSDELDPASRFDDFGNGVGVSDDGSKIVFLADTLAGGNEIVLYDLVTDSLTTVAAEGSDVMSLDFFAPDVNDAGQVVFRGDALGGDSGVFLFDPADGLSRLAGEGDLVQTDLGLVQLGRRDGDFSQGGAPRINALGDVSYRFQYFDPSDPNSVAAGSLLLVNVVPEPATAGLLAIGGLALLRRR